MYLIYEMLDNIDKYIIDINKRSIFNNCTFISFIHLKINRAYF
jgi:hypothetical protein